MKVQTEAVDLERLVQAAELLGCTVIRDAEPRYYGTAGGGHESQRCELVIRLPGRYDLGVLLQVDGSTSWVCDSELLTGSYGRSDLGRAIIGENAEKLLRQYGQIGVENQLIPGAAYFNTAGEDGTIYYHVEESELERLGYRVNG